MNKNHILSIMHKMQSKSPSKRMRANIRRLENLDNDTVLEGLNRYIENCRKLNIALEVTTFEEIILDAKVDNFVWREVRNDLAFIPGQRNSGQLAKGR